MSPVEQQATYSKFAAVHGLINGRLFLFCVLSTFSNSLSLPGPQVSETQALEKACVDAINSFPNNEPIPAKVNDVCNEIEEYIVSDCWSIVLLVGCDLCLGECFECQCA